MKARDAFFLCAGFIQFALIASGAAAPAVKGAGKPLGASPSPLQIIATDAGLEGPESIPAGLRHIIFTNRGSETHEAMLVKLPQGMAAEAYVSAVRGGSLFPEGASDYSGVGLTSPGETAEIWTRVDPGNYVVICWNGDHARTRRAHSFTVSEDAVHDDPPPTVDVVLRMTDFRFEFSRPLRRGSQVLRIDNAGPSMHEADFFRLLDGKTVKDLVQWLAHDGTGERPAVALGGALDSHDLKRQVWLRRSFTPGRYVVHCEMPLSQAAQAGTHYTTHAELGMVMGFEIGE
ncbi:MAG: hypothetical protein ABI609_17275 [Acidobacteriota bacterium]